MNDEIKEKMTIGKAKKILRGFLAKDCYFDTPLYYAIPYLLDYITNLQEQLHQASLDIQELTEKDIECPSWCDKLTNLQQENERLKEAQNNFEKQFIKEMDYKSRIEKAVEYVDVITNKGIYESGYGKGTAITICKEHLLDILNGRSDE